MPIVLVGTLDTKGVEFLFVRELLHKQGLQTLVIDAGVLGPAFFAPDVARDEVFAAWSARIRELAGCPNVHIKLGGLGMKLTGFTFFENDMPPSSEDLEKAWRPYIETCINAFGPQRSMFESNFPVDKGMCSYANLWNAFKRVAESYSQDEKNAMFHNTALKFYRLW